MSVAEVLRHIEMEILSLKEHVFFGRLQSVETTKQKGVFRGASQETTVPRIDFA